MTDTFVELFAQELDENGGHDGDHLTLCVNVRDIVFFGIHPKTTETFVRIQMGYETVDYFVKESYESLLARVMRCGTVQMSRTGQ